ncbi:MAG: hypothetical protein KF767_05890 [Bdellovibrionaceae bacterium]|nr:hypothetical protein [Pseudobdellovibrionaceae bacterium]
MLLGSILSVLIGVSASGAPPAGQLRWSDFQIGGISTWQGSGQSGGGVVRILPAYGLNDAWIVGASLDAAYLKLDTDVGFAGIGLMAYVRKEIADSWSLQLNAGLQTWTCDGCGTKPVLGPTLSREVSFTRWPWVQSLWLAYLPVLHDETAHELQLGAGLHF